MRAFLLATVLLTAVAACATYKDELVRSQQAFDKNEHERTLALLKDLEPNVTKLTGPEQAHYAYLRGMTDYRIGYRSDARHWLAIARAHDEASPGVLPADWKARASETLTELDAQVHAEGVASLAGVQREGTEAPPSKKK